jgi:hypothetical protein
MSFKTTLTLLVVLIVALGLSWYMGIFSPGGAAKPLAGPVQVVEAGKVFLIAPRLMDVNRIRLDLPGRGFLVLEKKGETWQIIEPVVARALGWELTDLISGFEQARKLETIENPDTKALGLDEPLYKITFEEKGRKLSYLVGKNVVASDNTYVKTADGKEAIVVDQNLRTKVKKDLSGYRDKQLWELKRNKITELVFTDRQGTTFTFLKTGDGKWVMTAPVRASVSIDAITSTINAVSALRAEEFADDKPAGLATYGLEKPAWKIVAVETEQIVPTTKPAEKGPVKPVIKRTENVIYLGNQTGLKSDQVFAKLADKNWVVSIKESDIKTILPTANAWREKKILDLDRSGVAKIHIRNAGKEITLTKVEGAWKLQSGKDQVAADARAVENILDALTGLEAAGFIDRPDPRFIKKNRIDQPVCTVNVFAGAKVEPIELSIGEVTPSGMFRYVKRRGLEYVAAVSNEKILPLLKPALAYRNKRILEFNMDQIKTIEVVHGKQTYKIERADRTRPWILSAPLAAPADQNNVQNLLLALTVLEAAEFVGQNHLDEYGLQKPQVLVKLVAEFQPVTTTPATGTKPVPQILRQEYSLAVSKRDGKVYVIQPDAATPLIARVPDSLYSALTAEFIDRKAYGELPTYSIDRLEIKRPGSDPAVFVKSAGEWKYPADPVFPVDRDKLEQILTGLAQVKAVRFVEFQPTEKYGLARPHFKITVFAGKKSWSLDVGQISEKQNRYARTSERPWVFELSADDYARLDKNLKELARPAVTPTPADEMPMQQQGMPGGMEILR